MATYKAPLREIRFVLHELLGIDEISKLPGYGEATADVIDAILEEGAKLCESEIFPLNRTGDEEGCHYENGVVRTPKGFKEAYKLFIDGGWSALSCDPAYGGQGLPKYAGLVFEEMICSANISFGMYPGLSAGAYNAIEQNASEEIKKRYLPKLVTGTWAGTMCLTEPQCGTDLGLLRTRAEPAGDGSYKITGTKIFISAGEHDLTENILHLTLARLPDAPAGTKGISLFLVPKFLPNADGSIGPRNGVRCGSIEHKMGIKASSTCVMNFDDAKGWLVGEPNQGMRCMFVMMNAARLGVGIQGLGIAETAYQSAVAYAKDRLQGRSLAGAKQPDKPADPIIVHPDVRRMLLTIRAQVEAARALAYWIGMEIDKEKKHPDPASREAAEDVVALLTPIIKAYFTDMGFEAANLAVQTFGGHGFIRENGVEQLVRDARITQLYEGTNGIQALDLVGRKLGSHVGRLLRRFFHPVLDFIEANQADPKMAEFVMPLAKAFGRLQQATAWLAEQGLRDPEEVGAAASDYLRLFGLVALGFMWSKMAKLSLAKLGDGGSGEGEFYRAKLSTARFFMTRLLPQTGTYFSTLMAGKKPLMEMAEVAF
ncbi:MAG TPA: acyl-CoA dehydrogenase C-terminal domain-containing protein [Alphaproteobacteria bacterium]|nr:acyl-CoA dehydrogenase C-terminal domain-containing protein [Alphaproteobacteria bacterium]